MKVKIVKKLELKDIYFIENFLTENNIESTDNIQEADIIISLGGDGTILSLVPLLRIKNIPVFAINYGNVGYMTKVSKENFEYSFLKYLNGEFSIEHRDFLEIVFRDKIYYALNEISILKSEMQAHLIEISVFQKNNLINNYRADGIIVATPTGSTAYSLSANGPIIHPDIRAICITPLAPQTLSARSIIVSPRKELILSAKSKSGIAGLNIDGNLHYDILETDKINVKLSDKGIDLICVDDLNYFETLKKKLHWS